ncbi:MAG: type II toxin-antitoxin system ParD family antitoxin [Deltaproteobacteria bacterium]|nr:type II toxin-antitoxin system ParD family antitoxin [Deltaproteobacteria bacterium]
MNVSLTPELEKLVQAKLSTGLYHTASEVVRDGLRLLKERDEFHDARLASLRADVDVGLAQLEAGQGKQLEPGLRQAIKARARGRRSAGPAAK